VKERRMGTMSEFEWRAEDAARRPLPNLATHLPAGLLITALVLRRGGQAPAADPIDRHLERLRGRAESTARLRRQDFASGR
jgi:hypothetical protein